MSKGEANIGLKEAKHCNQWLCDCWLQIDKDREANVTDAAIEALGALAGQLPWVQYEQLLNQWLKVMKKTATKVLSSRAFFVF